MKLIIWPNGETVDSAFEIKISKSVNSIERLKNLILSYLCLKSKSSYNRRTDRIILYSYKGLELDDADINFNHLENDQAIYLSLDGK